MSQRPFWNEPVASVLEGVGSSEAGLSAAEARARLKRIGPNEPAPDGVAHELLRVFGRKVGQPGRAAHCLDERVRHRTAQDAGDAGKGFEQRRDLRTTEFGWHDRGG